MSKWGRKGIQDLYWYKKKKITKNDLSSHLYFHERARKKGCGYTGSSDLTKLQGPIGHYGISGTSGMAGSSGIPNLNEAYTTYNMNGMGPIIGYTEYLAESTNKIDYNKYINNAICETTTGSKDFENISFSKNKDTSKVINIKNAKGVEFKKNNRSKTMNASVLV